MFPQKHLYYCSIGFVTPANQGKNIFFQLQSQNMHHAVKYNMHYTMSTCTYSADLFWVHNIFLNVVPVLNAFAIWLNVCFRKRDRSSTFMSSNTCITQNLGRSERSWHQCTSCCDIGNHAEYNRTGITISSLFLKLDNIYFA